MAMSYSFLIVYFFFFFKQKTAYEMRISDWSSDVCSSDLIKKAAGELKELFDKRTPPPGTSPSEVLKRQFWTGRKIFVFADDVTSWNSAQNPQIGRASCRESVCQYV